MVSGVLTLAGRSIRSVMTPRTEISWVDLDHDADNLLAQLQSTPHSQLPVCRGQADNLLGIARTKDLIRDLALHRRIDESLESGPLRAPIFLPETAGVLRAIETLKRAHGQLIVITDEYGTVQGLLTPVDILEAIAGEFPDEDEQPTVERVAPGKWRVDGAADLHHLEQVLETNSLVSDGADYTSLAGFLLARFETLPEVGAALELDGLRYEIIAVEDRRIAKVQIDRIVTETAQAD